MKVVKLSDVFVLTEEEKKRWAPLLHQVWQNIAPDAEPLLPRGIRARKACIIEFVLDADRPQMFSDMTKEENRVLGRLWAAGDKATMTWLRDTLNY